MTKNYDRSHSSHCWGLEKSTENPVHVPLKGGTNVSLMVKGYGNTETSYQPTPLIADQAVEGRGVLVKPLCLFPFVDTWGLPVETTGFPKPDQPHKHKQCPPKSRASTTAVGLKHDRRRFPRESRHKSGHDLTHFTKLLITPHSQLKRSRCTCGRSLSLARNRNQPESNWRFCFLLTPQPNPLGPVRLLGLQIQRYCRVAQSEELYKISMVSKVKPLLLCG